MKHNPASNSVPGLTARLVAVKLLAAIIDRSNSLSGVTDETNGNAAYLALTGQDRSLVRMLIKTALRHRAQIDAALGILVSRPLPKGAKALVHGLHVGAAQILYLDVPDSAAVNLAVAQAKQDPRLSRFSGLVNGVLRNLIRRKDEIRQKVASRLNGAEWLINALCAQYGMDRAEAILAACQREPGVDFTVKSDPEQWAERLGGVVLPNGSVRVDQVRGAVSTLPGYSDGQWWVQDAAAAIPATLLGDVSGLEIADLCAAPGGKTAQLAHAGAHVTAIERSKSRLARLEENLTRLGLRAELVLADVRSLDLEMMFDKVLLDVPCSSTGTARRHPDLLWTKTGEEVGKLADLQADLLRAAMKMVKPNGQLVYVNCSLLHQEGEDVIKAVMMQSDHFVVEQITAKQSLFATLKGYLRTFPDDWTQEETNFGGVDGFFAASIRRIA